MGNDDHNHITEFIQCLSVKELVILRHKIKSTQPIDQDWLKAIDAVLKTRSKLVQ